MYRRRRPNSLVCDGDDDLERPLRNLVGVSLLLQFKVFVRSLAPRPVRLIVAPPTTCSDGALTARSRPTPQDR